MAIPSEQQIKNYIKDAADGLEILKRSFEDFSEQEFTELVRDEARLITWVEDILTDLQESASRQFGRPAEFDDYESGSSITNDKISVLWESFGAKIELQWKRIWSGDIRFYVTTQFK